MSDTPKPRVTYITAGAGGMYCGSCIRDNALVGELTSMGWDITLLPLYTPIRTDDVDHSVDQVLFGGVNVYLQQKIPLFRHLPAFFDRWLDNPKFIRRVTSGKVNVDASQLGAMTLSMVNGEDGFQKREVRKLVHWLKEVAKPELICLTNLLVGGSIPALKRELGIPIIVTLQGDDVFLDELAEPWRSKVLASMKQLALQVDGFITFSEYYRDRMADLLDIPINKFHTTRLGIDTAEFEPVFVSRKSRVPSKTIGYFARICPEKGFDRIVDAFLKLSKIDPSYRLVAGGWLSAKDESFFVDQVEKIKEEGLSERFDHIGSPDHAGKLRFFETIDVFCVPTRFVEPKGLYLLEAMACGIPVIAPNSGHFTELLSKSRAGLLFDPGSIEDLVLKFRELDSNPINLDHKMVISLISLRSMANETAILFRSQNR